MKCFKLILMFILICLIIQLTICGQNSYIELNGVFTSTMTGTTVKDGRSFGTTDPMGPGYGGRLGGGLSVLDQAFIYIWI